MIYLIKNVLTDLHIRERWHKEYEKTEIICNNASI